jgi:hypothetical protein
MAHTTPVQASKITTATLTIILATFPVFSPRFLCLGDQILSLMYRTMLLLLVIRFLQCPTVVNPVENAGH